jgi:hypothetical protein
MSSATCPGACAPSTIVNTPARRAAAQISSTGWTSAVGEVMCETTTARVRIPMLEISSSGSTRTTLARMKPSVRRMAPYSCFVVRISSFCLIRSERMTAFSAEVALGVNTRSSFLAPTKEASADRAPSSSSVERRARKSVGSRSSSRCRRWYSSNTSTGQAPKPPWLKYATSGSRRKPERMAAPSLPWA